METSGKMSFQNVYKYLKRGENNIIILQLIFRRNFYYWLFANIIFRFTLNDEN